MIRTPRGDRPHRLALLAALLVLCTAAPALGQYGRRGRTEVIPGHRQVLQKNSHALGFSGGVAGATGFCYRHYLGNTFLQANILPVFLNRGDYLMLMGGLTAGRYLIMWHAPSMGSFIPSTSALRAVASVTGSLSRDTTIDPDSGKSVTTREEARTIGGGIGFEFGALMRHGFSVSFDLMLTAWWDEKGFDSLLPLPSGAIVYNW